MFNNNNNKLGFCCRMGKHIKTLLSLKGNLANNETQSSINYNKNSDLYKTLKWNSPRRSRV